MGVCSIKISGCRDSDHKGRGYREGRLHIVIRSDSIFSSNGNKKQSLLDLHLGFFGIAGGTVVLYSKRYKSFASSPI
jgi:hypothetical protein